VTNQGRAECLPFTNEVFDLIFATLSLRHWTDLPAGIAEIGRVLIPGGSGSFHNVHVRAGTPATR
jgi:ubiquinone/menaquinone biosynthesis C-methylase UbiE